jgi:hypothetical protein
MELRKANASRRFPLLEWSLSGSILLLCGAIWMGMLYGLFALVLELCAVQLDPGDQASEPNDSSIPCCTTLPF